MWHLWTHIVLHQWYSHKDELRSSLKKVRISIHHAPRTQVMRTHVIKGLGGDERPVIMADEHLYSVGVHVFHHCSW